MASFAVCSVDSDAVAAAPTAAVTLANKLAGVTATSSKVLTGVAIAGNCTASFLVTMVMDILAMKDNRRSLHILQLGGNLVNAIIWTFYGFMNIPVSAIVLVPNITGIATTALQIIAKVTFYICRRNQNQGRPAAASSA